MKIPIRFALTCIFLLGAGAVSAEQFTGCLARFTGALYNVQQGDTPLRPCFRDHQQITWSVEGPAGPEGPQGPEGPEGPPGDTTALEAEIAELREAVIALEEKISALLPLSATLRYVAQAFDLETGTIVTAGPEEVCQGIFNCFLLFPELDFYFEYFGGSPPTVLFYFTETGSEMAFLDGVAFEGVRPADIPGLNFRSEPEGQFFENNDTIVLRTSEGNVWKLGRPVDNNCPPPSVDPLCTVQFQYQQLQ